MLFGLGQIFNFIGVPINLEADYDHLCLGVTSAPEPFSYLLLGLGLAGLAVISRRRLQLS